MDETSKDFEGEFSLFPLKKRRFLEGYAKTGSVGRASLHAGVSRRTHLTWKAKDRKFAVAHEEALTIAVDQMEQEARRRGVEGVLDPVYYAGREVGTIRRYSDILLIFLLKAARPEKYRDNYSSFYEPPGIDRETMMQNIHTKLQRLARQQVGSSPDPGATPPAPR